MVSTDVYLFKDIDYIQLDDFKASDLTVKEGSKVNGYTALTSTPKVVDQDYLNGQISAIDTIVADQTYNDWGSLVSEISSNYVGMAKINSQINGDARGRKDFLITATRYMGDTQDQLNQKKIQFQNLNDGQEREITLGNLSMASTGYVYATVNSMEKVISESVLPYVDESVLDVASKVDQQDETALKIINSDHIYAAFMVSKDTQIAGEEDAMALKQENIGTTGTEKNTAYYDLLVARVDLLREYPMITIERDKKKYKVYLVDEIESDNKKIVIVLMKDYSNVFADENIISSNVDLQDTEAYQVPKSAITEEDGKSYITMMKEGYFGKKVEVSVMRTDNGKAVLPVAENPDLYVGMSYKVYP